MNDKPVRQYVVDHHQGGCTLPDRAEPSPLYTSEEDAIQAFKTEVKEALVEEQAERMANGSSTDDLRLVRDDLNAITIGLVLSLKVGEEIAVTVAGQRYYLMRADDQGAESEDVVEQTGFLTDAIKAGDTRSFDDILGASEDEVEQTTVQVNVISTDEARENLAERRKELLGRLDRAVKSTDIDEARKVQHELDSLLRSSRSVGRARVDEMLDEIDNLPADDEGYLIDRISREVKAGILIGLIEYSRENYRKPDLDTFAQGERNGIVNGILLTAGVPYAVVGEMRPSKEWQNAHETIRTMILSGEEHPELTAYWLLDLPKGEAASENQPDFAEQVRPTSEEVGGESRLPNPWFAKEAEASVALDGETFTVEGNKEN